MASAQILGIDEAGRGSVLGPLVVGGFLVPRDRIDRVAEAGAADSKTLSPSRREEVYAALTRLGACRSVALGPRTIDRHVRQGRLNELEAIAFARLVRATGPDLAHVDACDVNAHRFGALVRRLAGDRIPVVARHHADRDDPVVGAASIVAKVRRDRAVAALARRLGTEVGSGYPSDARTIAFLRARLARTSSVPAYVRASWATMKRVKPDRPARSLETYEP